MKLKVGLVGLGDHWETRHRPALLALSDRFEVKAVCCEVAHKAQQIARDFQAAPMDGFRAMVERPDIEAVLSLGPDWVGHLPLLAACEAGKAVYSAAALEIAPEQASQVKLRVDRSGVAFMAEFSRRHAAATLRLKELIATRLGPPKLIFCHHRLSHPPASKPGAAEQQRKRNLTELMEMIDWVCYLCGRSPESVMAVTEPGQEFTQSEYGMLSLNFAADAERQAPAALAQLSLGTYIPPKWKDAMPFRRPASIQVCCPNGIAFLDLPSTLIWFDEGGQHSESLEYERPVGEQLLTQFYRAVVSLIRVSSDLDDVYRSMNILAAVNKSIECQKRIVLEDFLACQRPSSSN